MDIEKPIFIIGVGRSGSTIFHNLFSNHPNCAWFSTFAQRSPRNLRKSAQIMKLIDYPLVGPYLQGKLNTFEAFGFWDTYIKGFSRPCRDLFDYDVTEKSRKDIKQALSQIGNDKRHRLLLKITGWPRVSMLKEIFPDAKFVHIIRDGRAVVNSMLNVGFWHGWQGPDNWRWGPLNNEQQAEWESHDKSFVVLAAIQWKLLMDAYEKVKIDLDGTNYTEVKYEDMCLDSVSVMKDVTEFCELPWEPKFEKAISAIKLRNSNNKWTTDLTDHQQSILNESLEHHLRRYHY